ncbi:ATP-dependent (S)-NAD(P)H-hydrate dehydratase [Cucumispora dikerogammari]|nr:ATP-dependent (S)-NAD(P)H-hydrate dehydratase [Cucumispora dikerogammari]
MIEHKKGDNGKILFLAGSELYTGAAHFCSQATLRLGADLVYIVTSGLSNISALKTLSPSSIVMDINTFGVSDYEWLLNTITAVVFGPGLSREVNIKHFEILSWFENYRPSVLLIIDADGLFHMQTYKVKHKFENVVLTPNHNEVKWINFSVSENKWVIKKNVFDTIELNGELYETINEFGSPRRCGGLGDILTGILPALISNCKLNKIADKIKKICILSCLILRFVAKKTYTQRSFCMTAADCLQNINIETLNDLLFELKKQNKYEGAIEIIEIIINA